MELKGDIELLRIYVDEGQKVGHTPLYELIVRSAHEAGLPGATVLRGIMGFGAGRHIHTTKVLDLAAVLPVVIEMVASADQLAAFLPKVQDLLARAGGKGLATRERVEWVRPA